MKNGLILKQSCVPSFLVMQDHINFGGNVCSTIAQVKDVMGSPTYQGDSFATFPEIIGIYEMSKTRNIYSGKPEIDMSQDLNDLATVKGYTRSYPVYLFSFERDGLLYSFLTKDSGGTGFEMYFISVLKEGDSAE